MMEAAKKPGEDGPSHEQMRWAFLVTRTEASALIDEIQVGDRNLPKFNAMEEARHRACIAPMNINGVFIFPDLPENFGNPALLG
jgi:hypothetical protein